MNDAEAPLKG